MSLTLEIISGHRRTLGARANRTFGQGGGTIGRSIDTDWRLPDSKRFLSGKHACIDFRSGSYYIVDTSTNGVFVNDSDEPVGKGNPQRLFSGDRIRIGEYEMRVSIDNADDTRESLFNPNYVDPVDARQKVESPDPTSYDLLAAHAMTGIGVDIRLEEDTDCGPDLPVRSDDPTTAVTKIGGSEAEASTSLDAFFRGAGMQAPKLDARQAERLLTRLGQVTRELVAGTVDCLQIRAMQKSQLKQSNTVVQRIENNRLKFAVDADDGLKRLLLEDSDRYMKPAESVRAVFADVTAHQKAMLAAMRDALDEYLEKLDPETIENGAGSGRTGALANAANPNRFRELYQELFSVLGVRAGGELPQPFLDELARAYERELTKAQTTSKQKPELKAG